MCFIYTKIVFFQDINQKHSEPIRRFKMSPRETFTIENQRTQRSTKKKTLRLCVSARNLYHGESENTEKHGEKNFASLRLREKPLPQRIREHRGAPRKKLCVFASPRETFTTENQRTQKSTEKKTLRLCVSARNLYHRESENREEHREKNFFAIFASLRAMTQCLQQLISQIGQFTSFTFF